MNDPRPSDTILKKRTFRPWLFPATVLAIYGILFVAIPGKALDGLECSGKISLNIFFPLCFVFILMVFLNLFLKVARLTKLLEKGVSVRGVLLTITAGILSMGPIYAWYPLLKSLRERGIPNSLIAIFLGNRSIKPFLFPVMISYFGWNYTLILSFLTVLGTLALGYGVGLMANESQERLRSTSSTGHGQ